MFAQKDIRQIVEESCKQAGATCLQTEIHFFKNGGYTLFSLLAESHLAIHTYVEHRAVFLDIFTCGATDSEKILHDLAAYYRPQDKQVQVLKRGVMPTV